MYRLFGLIGYPLGHSWSKKYFDHKFRSESIHDAIYQLFSIKHVESIRSLPESYPNLVGLNVTIPHKATVIPYLDFLEPVAEQINAVNTISIMRNGSSYCLQGFNTDVIGFELSVSPMLKPHHRSAIILGTGGAARAAAWVFNKLNIDHIFVSRFPRGQNQISYEELNREIPDKYSIIVNATPLGMSPEVHDHPPIPYHLLDSRHLLFDMIYNPVETIFLQSGRNQGATTANGLEMLYLQAEKSWEIWNLRSA